MPKRSVTMRRNARSRSSETRGHDPEMAGHDGPKYATEYLRNGGKLEIAQQMANHESARTTGLYDRRDDNVSLDEVEKIVI
jgi:hypothetical protein